MRLDMDFELNGINYSWSFSNFKELMIGIEKYKELKRDLQQGVNMKEE